MWSQHFSQCPMTSELGPDMELKPQLVITGFSHEFILIPAEPASQHSHGDRRADERRRMPMYH